MQNKNWRVFIWVCAVVLTALIILPKTLYASESSFGISVFLMGGIEMSSQSIPLSVYVVTYENRSARMTLDSEFHGRGTQPNIKIYLHNYSSTPTLLKASRAVIDIIFYYVPSGGKILEWGTYSSSLLIQPKNYSDETLYQFDFTEEAAKVFDYFSSKVGNLSREDVGFGGRFSIQAEFANATNAISNQGYLRFPFTFDGNISFIALDFTIPEDSDMSTAKLGTEDMTKVFPNRVRTVLSVSEEQRKESDIYLEWRIPSPPAAPDWYDRLPWRFIIPGLVGVTLTIAVRDVFPRLWKHARKRTRKWLRGYQKRQEPFGSYILWEWRGAPKGLD